MTRLWQSGFELASTTADVEFSNVTGAGTTIQSTTARTGTYALRCNPAATTSFVRYHVFTSDQSTLAYQRIYLRIATAPGANTTIMRFANTANNQCAQIRLTSSRTLVLLDAGSTPVGSASSALNLDQWYCVELKLDASTSPGTIDARLDGTSFVGGPQNNSAQSPWARVIVGPVVSATCDLYFDDWAVNDSSGSVQNSWPGEGKILHLVPTADGDAHAWLKTDGTTAGDANNYTLVDEAPPDDGTTMVQSVTANAEDMYNVTDSGINSWDTVNVVMVGGRHSNDTAADATTAFRYQVKKASGGTVLQSASIVPNSTTWVTNAGAQPRNYPIITTADPDGAAWTRDTLDSMQIGAKIITAGTRRARITAVWASVDYTPGTVPAGLTPHLTSQYTGFF